jgi:tyrosyl-tRNA synthetase
MSGTITDEKKIDELLTRGVDKIYPNKDALKQVLLSGKKLKLYQGFDPTGDKLHIGHMVGLRKHRQWQDLGHEVIFLIGDGTGVAGDPTGKKKTREKFFTRDELRANAKSYVEQASKIVRFDGLNPVQIFYNGDWLDKLTKVEILDIAQHFSVQQLIERDMFQERMKAGETINLREFLYPLLQGYDSVAMDVDLELGGTDQTFNMLCGRTLMKAMKSKEKFVMTMPLLADSNGVKIGKSEGNVIGLTDEPADLFGKIMSLSDDAIIPMFTLLTDTPLEEIDSFSLRDNPLVLKKQVASLVIAQLHDKEVADDAQNSFEKTFVKGGIPDDVIEVAVASGTPLVNVLLAEQVVSSKTEFRRLVDEGAITSMVTKERITDPNSMVQNDTYKIGKRRFIKIKVTTDLV